MAIQDFEISGLDGNNYHMDVNARKPERQRELCELFDKLSRERGLRMTPQRRSLYRVLVTEANHPTAEQLHERLKSLLPSLSLTSVYRILEALVKEGFVRKVSTTDGLWHFDANMEKHQHLVCRSCGRLDDCDVPALSGLTLPEGAFGAFAVEDIDIRIVGLCPQCREPQTP